MGYEQETLPWVISSALFLSLISLGLTVYNEKVYGGWKKLQVKVRYLKASDVYSSAFLSPIALSLFDVSFDYGVFLTALSGCFHVYAVLRYSLNSVLLSESHMLSNIDSIRVDISTEASSDRGNYFARYRDFLTLKHWPISEQWRQRRLQVQEQTVFWYRLGLVYLLVTAITGLSLAIAGVGFRHQFAVNYSLILIALLLTSFLLGHWLTFSLSLFWSELFGFHRIMRRMAMLFILGCIPILQTLGSNTTTRERVSREEIYWLCVSSVYSVELSTLILILCEWYDFQSIFQSKLNGNSSERKMGNKMDTMIHIENSDCLSDKLLINNDEQSLRLDRSGVHILADEMHRQQCVEYLLFMHEWNWAQRTLLERPTSVVTSSIDSNQLWFGESVPSLTGQMVLFQAASDGDNGRCLESKLHPFLVQYFLIVELFLRDTNDQNGSKHILREVMNDRNRVILDMTVSLEHMNSIYMPFAMSHSELRTLVDRQQKGLPTKVSDLIIRYTSSMNSPRQLIDAMKPIVKVVIDLIDNNVGHGLDECRSEDMLLLKQLALKHKALNYGQWQQSDDSE